MSRRLQIAAFSLSVLVGCASQQEVPTEDPQANTTLTEESAVVSESLTRVGIATPESLELAILDLSLSDAGDTERGVELVNTALGLYGILYPLLKAPAASPGPFSPTSIFPKLFDAVRQGQYPDVVPESASFLTLVIPPLAALNSQSPQVEERSRESLLQAETLNPESIIPDLVLGVIAERHGNLDEAESRYKSALAKSTRAYPAEIGIARIDLARGDVSAAIEITDRLRTELPPSVNILELSARAYYTAGRNAEADALIQEAITLENDSQATMRLILLRAQILAASGNYATARNLLTIVEPRRPDDPDMLLLKADLLAHDGKYGDALSVMERARELYPSNSRIRDSYGRLLVKSGRVEAGREILESSLDSGPANEGNLKVLLDAAVASKHWQDAAGYVDRLLEIEESDEYLATAIDIHIALDDYEGAAKYAERRYTLNPDNVQVIKQYAQILIKIGDTETADELLQEGLNVVNDSVLESDLLYLRSTITNDRTKKTEFLELSLFANLQNFDALVAYAKLFEENGDIKRALRYLRQAANLRQDDPEVKAKIEELSKQQGE